MDKKEDPFESFLRDSGISKEQLKDLEDFERGFSELNLSDPLNEDDYEDY